MDTIAFLGLGAMGLPMARRLLATDHRLVVWNRTASRASSLVGAQVASSPADAARSADVVITMLADPAAVTSVLAGVAETIRPGTLVIEMSTIGPAAVASLASSLPAGVELVDAPVQGSVGPAAEGTLRILAGGSPAALDRAEPVLRTFGTVTRTGPLGSGAAAKVVANTAMLAGLALLGDVLKLADTLGVDAVELVRNGPLAGVLKRYENTAGRFLVPHGAKDLDLAVAADPALPVVAAARDLMVAAAVELPEADVREAVNLRLGSGRGSSAG